jgi:hypothetical protein
MGPIHEKNLIAKSGRNRLQLRKKATQGVGVSTQGLFPVEVLFGCRCNLTVVTDIAEAGGARG